MRFLLLFFLTIPAFAAVTLRGVDTSNTQAVIRYTAPSASACTLEAWDMDLPISILSSSGSGSVLTINTRLSHGLAAGNSIYLENTGVAQWNGPQTVASITDSDTFTVTHATSGSGSIGSVGLLVHDVNTTLFSGSNSDDRAGNPNSGRYRTFVLGTRKSELIAGTINIFSRALQAYARHIYKITCGGDTATGEFRTSTIGLGQLAIDVPKPSTPGGSAWPTLDKSGRWERSNGVALDRVIDPLTGALYTNMYPPEITFTTAYGLNTTNTPTPTGANWTNPGNVRTNDSTSATYAAATQDVLCIRPYLITMTNSAATLGNIALPIFLSLENMVATVRGSGAGSGADGDVEVAYSTDSCLTTATDWKTIDLTGSLTSVSFPSGTPQAGFAEWHSGTQKRLNHTDIVTKRGSANTSGTAVTTGATLLARFTPSWGNGSKIRIGGSTTDGCVSGTEYDIASVENPRNLTLQSTAGTQSAVAWCSPNFGIMIRKKTTSTDQINIDYVDLSLITGHLPTFQDSGSAKVFSEKPLADADGNLGYLTHISGAGGGSTTMHWVSKDNGESRFIMGYGSSGSNRFPAVAGTDGWVAHGCGATENTFSSTDPTKFYCIATGNGGDQVIIEYQFHQEGSGIWRGQTPSATPLATCTTTSPPSPNPCLSARNLHAGYTLTELLQDRNPDFDPAKFPTMSIRGVQGHHAVLFAYRSVQDTVAWFAAFDLDRDIASYDSMDQSTNPVRGAISTLHPGLRGISVLHSAATLPGSDQYIIMNPKFGRRTNLATDNNGAGPYRMDIVSDAALNNTTDISACPDNQWGYVNCSVIVVTSEPFDPDPGVGETGAAGEYRGNVVGDGGRLWKCDPTDPEYTHETVQEGGGKGCDAYANDEYVRILAMSGTAPTISLTIARGVVAGFAAKSHVSGYKLYNWALTDQNVRTGNVLIMWDFVNSPIGTPESGVTYFSQDIAHMSATSRLAVGGSGVTGYNQIGWRNPTISSIQQNPPVNLALPVLTWPPQFGKFGMRYANTIQQYKANNHTDIDPVRETAYQFFIDSRPFMNTPTSAENALFEKVGGATYLYKYKGIQDLRWFYPYFKHLPYYITSAYRTLMEKSGPSVTLADNSTDHWKFCTAWLPNECASGSVFGDIYVNLPYANLTYQADYSCAGANNWTWEEADICASNLDPVMGPNVQFYVGNSDTMARGRHLRKVGWGLVEQPKMYQQVPKVFPNGEWLGPFGLHLAGRHRSTALMQKLPPIPPEDAYDRTTFVPVPVSAGSAPAGTAVAQIEFGYHDFGTPAQFYCTVRQESCLATNSKVIGDAVVSAVYSTSNPAASYPYTSVTVSATTPITITFGSAHKFTGDVRIKGSTGTSASNNKLWPITVDTSTQITLTGSNSGDVTSGTQNAMVPVIESPFAFSGESLSVASASTGGTIEIGTTTMHKLFTGANVCISGVGGNTAANGCWTVTATGPSSFTLTGSTGNGTYTSGGTVTPGGVSCASGCTVTIPGLTKHVMFYRWRYLGPSGLVIATGGIRTVVVP